MCPPILMALVGTAVSAAGSIAGGMAQKAQYDAQAKADRMQADQELKQSQYQADRQKEEGQQILGQQNAQVSASGFGNTGSPSDLAASTASSLALDNSAILYGGKVKSDQLRYQAELARTSGKNAMIGAGFSAAGNVFSGLGSMGKMYDPNKTFMGNTFGYA